MEYSYEPSFICPVTHALTLVSMKPAFGSNQRGAGPSGEILNESDAWPLYRFSA